MNEAKEPAFGERFERSLSELQKSQSLKRTSKALMIACHCINVISAALLIRGGMKTTVIFLAVTALACYISSEFIENHIKRVYARAKLIKDEIDLAEKISEIQSNGNNPAGKIPLTVGFMNIAGNHLDMMLLDDAIEMSRIFRSTSLGRNEVPKSDILFVYANIDPGGEFANSNHQNPRLIAKKAGASIVIVATPNSPEHIKKAISTQGPKLANIIFTIDRKDESFRNFFKSLFQKMRDGSEMLSCWVELNPQMPQGGNPNAPATVLVAEAGKIAFQS